MHILLGARRQHLQLFEHACGEARGEALRPPPRLLDGLRVDAAPPLVRFQLRRFPLFLPRFLRVMVPVGLGLRANE